MDISMFQTNWIWTPDWSPEDEQTPRIVYFRREFAPGELPRSLRITADNRYKLYLNGRFVSEGPQKGDLETWYLDTVDISAFLAEGANAVAVEVLRYPQSVNHRNHSLYGTQWPCLYIEGLTKSGWRCKTSGIAVRREETNPAALHILEDAAGDTAFAGWKQPGYDDSGWLQAQPYLFFDTDQGVSPFNLQERTIPAQRHRERQFDRVMCFRDEQGNLMEKDPSGWEALIHSGGLTIPANTTETVELSAGALECGYLQLAFSGGAGAKLTIRPSECYAIPQPPRITPIGEMPLSIKCDRADYKNGRLNGPEDHYTVGGFGTAAAPETYEPYWFRTFRYMQIKVETGSQALSITGLSYRSTGYPLEAKTSIAASDGSFAGIWEISLRTLERCMHETYFDCPFYEQLAYAMDSRSEILYTYAVSADDRLARQTMEDFRRSQRADGMTNASAPTVKSNVIPGFSVYYLLMVHDHMMYFGDRSLVRRHFPAIQGILNFFGSHLTAKGLVAKVGGPLMRERYWSFIDWDKHWNETAGVPTATLAGDGSLTMESLLYLYGLQHGADLAEYLGYGEMAQEYRSQAGNIREAIREHCFGEYAFEHGETVVLLQDGPGVEEYSAHCQVFGILTGVLDAGEGRRALEAVLDKGELFPQCSVAMRFYLFRALEKLGWYERANELWELWRSMLRNHLTTCVENDTDQRSDCHAWGSTLLYELPSVYLGVRPAAPGYGKIRIAPVPGHLSQCEGTVHTPRGDVWVSWKKLGDGSLELNYHAPEGAEVVLG